MDRIPEKIREGKILLEIIKAIIFGIVEGITEWLPISSTGHMIILDDFKRDILFPINWRVITAVPKILIFLISFPFPG